MSPAKNFHDHHSADQVTRIIRIMTDKFGAEPAALSFETSFADDLDVDSLDFCEFISELEKEFKLRIPDKDTERLKTVGAVLDYVDRYLSPGNTEDLIDAKLEFSPGH